jgi:hypothetical protein
VPVAQVGDAVVDALAEAARLLDHVRAGVEADHVSLGPALRQQAGQVARAAAQVDHLGRGLGPDPVDQLDERPAALVGKGQVALGVPAV